MKGKMNFFFAHSTKLLIEMKGNSVSYCDF